MALSGLLKDKVEIEAPADKVYELYTRKPYEMNKSSPDKVQSVDLIEGQWGENGSVYCWNFVLDGKNAYNKVKVEMDDKKLSASYKTTEGPFMNSFKSFIISIQVIPTVKGSLVLWTFDFEKLNATVENPNSILQVAIDSCKDLGPYLNQTAKTQSSPQLQTN